MSTTSSSASALKDLASTLALITSANQGIAAAEPDPAHAAYFAWLTEQVAGQVARAQLHAVDALRRSGAHQLDNESLAEIVSAGREPDAGQLSALRGTLLAGRASFKSTVDMLKGWLNIPISTARDRVAGAEALIASISETGQRKEPNYPRLADEFQRAGVDPRLVANAARQLRRAEPDLGQNAEQARSELETRAVELISEEPASAGKHLSALVSQGISEQRPAEALFAEAGLFKRGLQRGLVVYQLKLFPHDAELIEDLCSQIDNPATVAGNRQELAELLHASGAANLAGQAGKAPEWGDASTMPAWAQEPQQDLEEKLESTATAGPEVDNSRLAETQLRPPAAVPEHIGGPPFEELTPALRHLTALMSALRATETTGRQTTGVTAPKVLVHLDYERMLAGMPDFAVTGHGIPLTPAEARLQMCNAGIYPVVFGGQGQVLDIGRAKRLFPPHMRRALVARDRGCIYPGCGMPPSRCEAHHVDPWEEGGGTSVERGCLLCPMHHHARHAGLFEIVVLGAGLPHVLLPFFLDPDQVPRRNTYWFGPAANTRSLLRGA